MTDHKHGHTPTYLKAPLTPPSTRVWNGMFLYGMQNEVAAPRGIF